MQWRPIFDGGARKGLILPLTSLEYFVTHFAYWSLVSL